MYHRYCDSLKDERLGLSLLLYHLSQRNGRQENLRHRKEIFCRDIASKAGFYYIDLQAICFIHANNKKTKLTNSLMYGCPKIEKTADLPTFSCERVTHVLYPCLLLGSFVFFDNQTEV
jgi:hypothetical protein